MDVSPFSYNSTTVTNGSRRLENHRSFNRPSYIILLSSMYVKSRTRRGKVIIMQYLKRGPFLPSFPVRQKASAPLSKGRYESHCAHEFFWESGPPQFQLMPVHREGNVIKQKFCGGQLGQPRPRQCMSKMGTPTYLRRKLEGKGGRKVPLLFSFSSSSPASRSWHSLSLSPPFLFYFILFVRRHPIRHPFAKLA